MLRHSSWALGMVLSMSACTVLVDNAYLPADGGTDGAPNVDANEDVVTTDTAPDLCSTMEDGAGCGAGRICVGGECVAEGCGNGFVEPERGEECDAPVGCAEDCTLECTGTDDCDDENECNGMETCDAGTCVPGDNRPNGDVCGDEVGEAICSNGLCVPLACGDGELDPGEQCDNGPANAEGSGCEPDCTFTCDSNEDCSDSAPCTVDICNSDTHTCENTFMDADGDGYAPIAFCRAPRRGGDCHDGLDNVNPGVSEYQATPYVDLDGNPSFDYNCDGEETSRVDATCGQCQGTLCNQRSGTWFSVRGEGCVPACGETGERISDCVGLVNACRTDTVSEQRTCL